jgi:hypothetical protein
MIGGHGGSAASTHHWQGHLHNSSWRLRTLLRADAYIDGTSQVSHDRASELPHMHLDVTQLVRVRELHKCDASSVACWNFLANKQPKLLQQAQTGGIVDYGMILNTWTHLRSCCSVQLTPPELMSSYTWKTALGSVSCSPAAKSAGNAASATCAHAFLSEVSKGRRCACYRNIHHWPALEQRAGLRVHPK